MAFDAKAELLKHGWKEGKLIMLFKILSFMILMENDR